MQIPVNARRKQRADISNEVSVLQLCRKILFKFRSRDMMSAMLHVRSEALHYDFVIHFAMFERKCKIEKVPSFLAPATPLCSRAESQVGLHFRVQDNFPVRYAVAFLRPAKGQHRIFVHTLGDVLP